jgi:hypothetical protein
MSLHEGAVQYILVIIHVEVFLNESLLSIYSISIIKIE